MTLHIGVNNLKNYVKITNDKDCLPDEITAYHESTGNVILIAAEFIKSGYRVCVDTGDIFYETE